MLCLPKLICVGFSEYMKFFLHISANRHLIFKFYLLVISFTQVRHKPHFYYLKKNVCIQDIITYTQKCKRSNRRH